MEHGLTAFQTKGCRCDICRKAAVLSTQKYTAAAKQRFKQDPTSLTQHGTYGYQIGCRCNVCTSSAKAMGQQKHSKQKAHFKETGTFIRPQVKHGSSTAYQYGCRCELCKQWKTDQRIRLMGAKA
nr:hypothetical protein [uncultured Acinetobacter sp.]